MNMALAHGILGIGHVFGIPLSYFNGVADHLRQQGHEVIEPSVSTIGSVAPRGNKLADAILGHFRAEDDVHVIAHSMGDLTLATH